MIKEKIVAYLRNINPVFLEEVEEIGEIQPDEVRNRFGLQLCDLGSSRRPLRSLMLNLKKFGPNLSKTQYHLGMGCFPRPSLSQVLPSFLSSTETNRTGLSTTSSRIAWRSRTSVMSKRHRIFGDLELVRLASNLASPIFDEHQPISPH